MIICIDGPAGAGKSTAAKGLARRLGFRFLDTGAMYRAVTLAAGQANVPLDDEQALAETARQVAIELAEDRVLLNGRDVTRAIRTAEITALTHFAADNPQVRARLVELQRQAAQGSNVVTEGRDQGTVVFPQAELKVFLTADPRARAERRRKDLVGRGEALPLDDVLAQQELRDSRDSRRAVGPLIPAADAVHVTTDGLTPEQVVDELERLARARMPQARPESLHSLFPPSSVAGEFGLVAHALGGIDGATYTNSREAWEQSCAAGYRLIEVDLRRTADGHIVCFHERTPPHLNLPGPMEDISRREFLAARYFGGFSPLDLDGLIELLSADERRYLIIDTAGRNADLLPAVVDRFRRVAPAALARTIPEVYSREDLEFVARLGAWPMLILTLYLCDYDDDAVVEAARHPAVGMVAMFGQRFNPALRDRLFALSRGVYVHTINDEAEAREYLAQGVGVYTDFVRPA